MSITAEPTRSFGAGHLLKCPMCHCTMSLSRRSPHTEHGGGYEKQTFECLTCKHVIERSVDFHGDKHK